MPTPPITSPLYILDQSGNAWIFTVDNYGRGIGILISPPPPSAISQVLLADTVTSQVWTLTATSVGSFPSLTVDWVLTSVVAANPAPNIIVAAPNGVVYVATVANGQLVTNRMPFSSMGITPISVLASHVQARLEEEGTAAGEFWSTEYEINPTLVEAMSDLMLLVGRPTQVVNIPYNLTLNSIWQPMPKGLFLITDMRGPQGQIHKVDLHSQDYVQSSWQSDWESDSSPNGPQRWMPINLTMFAVHPAPSVPQTVALDGIAYPVAQPWPWDGSQPVSFQDEFFSALEMYSAHVCRIKENGAEFQESLSLYNEYLTLARRMTEIQDRRDPLIFSPVLGGTAGLMALTKT